MSERLWLDYVVPPGSPWLGRLLLFGGLLLMAGLLMRHAQIVEEMDLLEKSIHHNGDRAGSGGGPGARALDWRGVLPVLEAAADAEVHLQGLTSTGDGLHLEGEAADATHALDYVQRLRWSGFFAGIEMEHTEGLPGGAPSAIRFSCRATRAGKTS